MKLYLSLILKITYNIKMATTKKTISLNADGRIWISTAEGKLIGKGRVELMEKIKQFGNRRFSRPLL